MVITERGRDTLLHEHVVWKFEGSLWMGMADTTCNDTLKMRRQTTLRDKRQPCR